MDAMITAINAVLPYLIYLILGVIFCKTGVMDEPFLNKLNQAVFRALFPITLFANTHKLKFDLASCSKVILTAGSLIVLLLVLSVVAVGKFEKENSRRGVIVQAMYRSNTLLFALGLAESIFGAEGAGLASVSIAFFVPLYNVLAIVILETYRGGKTDAKSLVKKVLQNPLFVGAITGLLFSFTGITLPEVFETTISKLSGMSTPLALIVLGGTMHLTSIRKNMKCISVVAALKMIVYPALVAAVCAMVKLSPVELFVVFILFATPVAVSSYPMAQNMGGDGELAGELVVMTTIASVLTLFGWITFLRSTGLI